MIDLNKAISIAKKNMPNFTVKNASEGPSFYVVNMIPKNTGNSGMFGEYMDGSFRVDKKTGKFEPYNPLIN